MSIKFLVTSNFAFIFTILFTISANAEQEKQRALCQRVGLEARSGDLIFIAVDSLVFRKIAETTMSWTSHVGIIFKENKDWVVYESRVPKSTVTPLCDFIDRALDQIVELRRYNEGLSKSDLRTLKSEATDRLGYYYHTGFDYDNESRMFCSKFVFDIFANLGVQVGRLETFQELFDNNPDTDLNFWNRWYLGRIPWERNTVTPASQLNDTKFTTVFSNHSSE